MGIFLILHFRFLFHLPFDGEVQAKDVGTNNYIYKKGIGILKKILLSGYFSIIFCIGILYVPVSLKWGPHLEFYDKRYVPLWQLHTQEFQVDDYYPIYELDMIRIIYEIGIVTLLFLIGYLLLKEVFLKNS